MEGPVGLGLSVQYKTLVKLRSAFKSLNCNNNVKKTLFRTYISLTWLLFNILL